MAKPVTGTILSGRIPLTLWDETGETYVVFRRPTRAEAERLASMAAQSVAEWTDAERGTMRLRERVPMAYMESEMACMCLVESNLCKESADGELRPLFIPGKTCRNPDKPTEYRDAFYRVWLELPNELAEEIIGKLQEFHPPFDWRNPGVGEV